jgi:hypothetical protein
MSPTRTYAPSRVRWTWTRFVVALALAASATHFGIAIVDWIQLLHFELADSTVEWTSELWVDSLAPVAQCALFAAISICALVESVLRYRRTLVWFAILCLGAAGAFFVDLRFSRFQISVDVATKEYWEQGGAAHYYCTWWWYNDRWVKKHLERWQSRT